jgi:hypothetical protein
MNRERPAPLAAGDGGLSWPLIIGLSALALLWPLVALTGLDELLGGSRPFVLIAVIATLWVGVVGLGRVARPILTLTLVGLGYGTVLLLLSFVSSALGVRELGGPATVTPLISVVPLALNTGYGALAGVIAAGVQRLRGRPA